MARAAPVMNADSSLRRKATKDAISAGLETRPVGLGAGPGSAPSGGAPTRSRYSGVSTLPVTSALTRAPRPAASSAAERVRPTTPCLAATYAAMPGTPLGSQVTPGLPHPPPQPSGHAGLGSGGSSRQLSPN